MCRLLASTALSMLMTACANSVNIRPQPDVLANDLLEYAQAACLARQPQAIIAEQGRAWANVIVQRSTADMEAFAHVGDAVKAALSHSVAPVTHSDAAVGDDITLYLMHCHEISRLPAVRAAAIAVGGVQAAASQP